MFDVSNSFNKKRMRAEDLFLGVGFAIVERKDESWGSNFSVLGVNNCFDKKDGSRGFIPWRWVCYCLARNDESRGSIPRCSVLTIVARKDESRGSIPRCSMLAIPSTKKNESRGSIPWRWVCNCGQEG